MTPKVRSSGMTVALVCGTLLATVVLILTNFAHSVGTPSAAPDIDILVTPVPTIDHHSTPMPARISPAKLLESLGTRIAADALAGAPTFLETAVPLPRIAGPLVDPALPLLAGPVEVPLEIHIPALKIKAAVLGVGLTLANAMAAPIGMRADDPIWQSVFWYRGGAIPGEVGTATFAGHWDDELGRPAVFAYLSELRTGDLIVIRDKRSGLDVPFIVTEMASYTDEESTEPAVLARIFGPESVNGTESLPPSDQLSHLTLITCDGAWVNGSFDLRLVVYATRASYPSG